MAFANQLLDALDRQTNAAWLNSLELVHLPFRTVLANIGMRRSVCRLNVQFGVVSYHQGAGVQQPTLAKEKAACGRATACGFREPATALFCVLLLACYNSASGMRFH